MPRHAKILLVTWDGAGNLPPQRALVRALVARGHAVHALAHDAVRDMLEADGATFLPLRGVRQHESKVAIPPDEEMPFFAEHITDGVFVGYDLANIAVKDVVTAMATWHPALKTHIVLGNIFVD